jgi:hypothetical protein
MYTAGGRQTDWCKPYHRCRWAGLAPHGTTHALPWHRLYVLSFERALRTEALSIANSVRFPPFEKDQWIKAAESLRAPRWDWTDPKHAMYV